MFVKKLTRKKQMKFNLMKRTIVIFIITIVYSGCATYDVMKMGTIDKQDKTIIVPASGILSMMEIKKMLLKNGWKLKVSNEGKRTVGTINEKVDIISSNYTKSRYSMYIEETVRMSQFVLTITVSIIDNRANEEVLTLFGDSKGAGGVFPSSTADELEKVLKELEQ